MKLRSVFIFLDNSVYILKSRYDTITIEDSQCILSFRTIFIKPSVVIEFISTAISISTVINNVNKVICFKYFFIKSPLTL